MSSVEVSKEDKEFVRTQLQLKEEDVKRDVEILKDWIKKQPHLPQGVQEDTFFEIFLIRNKGRVEKAKRSIDSYYTVKTAWPEVYENIHLIKPSVTSIDIYAIPELSKSKERIMFARIRKNTTDTFTDGLDTVKLIFALFEILTRYEYCSGLHLVVDLTDFRMELLKRFVPSLLHKIFTALSEVYSYRLSGFHLYNSPPWIGLFLNMLKPVLKRKMYERILIHHNIDSLLKVIPIESIPSEYGGKQLSSTEIIDKWDHIFEDQKQYLEKVEKLKSNEKLRVGEIHFDVDIFGVDGTFKKLNLD